MRYCPAALHTIEKSGGRRATPVAERFLRGKAIEGSVNFDSRKFRRVKQQLFTGRQICRIESLGPTLIGPSTCSDVDRSGLHGFYAIVRHG